MAFDNVDLKKADLLFKNGQYLESLKIVTLCLKAKSDKEMSDLEKCLYLGENITNKAIEHLNKKIDDNRFKNNRPNISSSDLDAPYKQIGLKLTEEYGTSRVIYDCDFFKRLKELFPHSKYKSEYEYVLIRSKMIHGPWKESEKALKEYLIEFPDGKYSIDAKYWLAMIYKSLWSIINPELNSQRTDVKYFRTGDNKADIEQAEKYRKMSINLFEEIISSKNNPSDPYIIEWVKQCLPYIKKGIPSGGDAIPYDV